MGHSGNTADIPEHLQHVRHRQNGEILYVIHLLNNPIKSAELSPSHKRTLAFREITDICCYCDRTSTHLIWEVGRERSQG